jgi:hypothetical protein
MHSSCRGIHITSVPYTTARPDRFCMAPGKSFVGYSAIICARSNIHCPFHFGEERLDALCVMPNVTCPRRLLLANS